MFVSEMCGLLSIVTFALAEVQLQDSLQQWVSVEAEVKVRAHFWLLAAFHPLVLRGRHPLDERVWDLQTQQAFRVEPSQANNKFPSFEESRRAFLVWWSWVQWEVGLSEVQIFEDKIRAPGVLGKKPSVPQGIERSQSEYIMSKLQSVQKKKLWCDSKLPRKRILGSLPGA